jgi:hypothetical protein
MQIFHTRRELGYFMIGLALGGALAGLYLSFTLSPQPLIPKIIRGSAVAEYAATDCLAAAPPLQDGALVWVMNPRPASGGFVGICARLVQNGQIVRSAAFRPLIRYKTIYGDTRVSELGTFQAGEGGVLQTGIMNVTDAVLELPVAVEVLIAPDANWTEMFTARSEFVFTENPLGYPEPE